MLQCTKCIRTCLQTFISEALCPQPSLLPLVSESSLRHRNSRKQQWIARRRYIAASRTIRAPVPNPPRTVGHERLSQDAVGIDVQKEQRQKKWAIEEELKFLRDPLKLSENTARLLRAGDKDRALELVRAISKYGAYIVAWNHLIDYEMSQKRVSSAMDIYNDVFCLLFLAVAPAADQSR